MSDRDAINPSFDDESADMGATVHVLPAGLSFAVAPGETVLAAARRHKLRWPSICNGQGNCTICHMQIEQGLDLAGPEGPGERERLSFAGRPQPEVRLACQSRPRGPLTVIKKGVRPLDPEQP